MKRPGFDKKSMGAKLKLIGLKQLSMVVDMSFV